MKETDAKDIKNSLKNTAATMKDYTGEKMSNMKDIAAEKGNNAQEYLAAQAQAAKEKAGDAMASGGEKLKSKGEDLGNNEPTMTEKVVDKAETLKEQGKAWIKDKNDPALA